MSNIKKGRKIDTLDELPEDIVARTLAPKLAPADLLMDRYRITAVDKTQRPAQNNVTTVNLDFDPASINPHMLGLKNKKPVKLVHVGPNGEPMGETYFNANGDRIKKPEGQKKVIVENEYRYGRNVPTSQRATLGDDTGKKSFLIKKRSKK
eukprot:GHVH01009503.1.p1 GENE.GHVH01009503.1~~GHVH01009503.1.p1  ORF type:complete len:151 (+),score=10.92 GHVH01009503.1:162-614(+)